jgi:hypothetical protein
MIFDRPEKSYNPVLDIVLDGPLVGNFVISESGEKSLLMGD